MLIKYGKAASPPPSAPSTSKGASPASASAEEALQARVAVAFNNPFLPAAEVLAEFPGFFRMELLPRASDNM